MYLSPSFHHRIERLRFKESNPVKSSVDEVVLTNGHFTNHLHIGRGAEFSKILSAFCSYCSFQFALFGNLKCYEICLRFLQPKLAWRWQWHLSALHPSKVTFFSVWFVLIYPILHSLHNNMAMVMVTEFYKVTCNMLCFKKHVITKKNIPEELHPAEI